IKPKRESEIPNLEILPLPTQTYVPFDNMEDRYNASTNEKWHELAGTLLYDYPKRNIITVEGNFGGKPTPSKLNSNEFMAG
ncbi:9465_t:CDS:2, partial [Ambispora leptoticha]